MHDVMYGNTGNDSWQQGRVVAGRYRLDEPVGAGAMGVVWRAADLRLDRTVAVKQLLVPADSRPEEMPQARQRVFREARIAARLKHPQAVAVYDVTTGDNHEPILVMEYVASQSLADLLVERGALPVEQVAHIGAHAAAALTAAHAAGIVHRDVKPANILLPEGQTAGSGSHDTIKITDFGLASLTSDGTGNGSGRVTGTPAFLAPETARGEPHTPASDVFSLGATLYAALEGEPPFGSVEDAGIQLQRVAYGQPRPPRHAGPLTRPLLAMLQEEPAARPTMSQVTEILTAVAYNPGAGPATASNPSTATPTRTPRRRRAAVAVFAGIALSVLGLLAVMLLGNDDTTSAAGSAGPPRSAPPGTSSPPESPAINAALLERIVTDYYTLLSQDPSKAWNLLGPALREQDREQFEKAWSEVHDIEVRSAPTATGNTVVVDVEYTVASGDRVRETHQHTMLTQDGQVLINSDDVLSSRVIKGDEEERRQADDGDHPPRDAIDDPIDDANPAPPPPPGSIDQPDDPRGGGGGPEQGRPGPGGSGPGGPSGGGPKGTSNPEPVTDPGDDDDDGDDDG